MQRLQQHLALSTGFVVASVALLLCLSCATYLVGVKRGENRARELLAQEGSPDTADLQRGASPLQVRVPATMQSTGGPSGEHAPAAPDAQKADAQAANPPQGTGLQGGLQLITYDNTPRGRELAGKMRGYLAEQGIADVTLVHNDTDDRLCVIVPVADSAAGTEANLRKRIRALAPPPFDKKFEFAKQKLPLVKLRY